MKKVMVDPKKMVEFLRVGLMERVGEVGDVLLCRVEIFGNFGKFRKFRRFSEIFGDLSNFSVPHRS